MRTKTLKLRGVDASAYCRDCDFKDHGSFPGTRDTSVGPKARRHVIKTGHAVEVYREKGIVIKPDNEA